MIYIVRAGDTDMVKIGFAVDVAARIGLLQTGSWQALTVIREAPGDRSVEAWFHRHFKAQRVRGEWFRFHADMLTVEPSIDEPIVNTFALADHLNDPVPTQSALLRRIEAFVSMRGIAETTFGKLVVNDGKFVGRLRAKSNMTVATLIKVQNFLNSEVRPSLAA